MLKRLWWAIKIGLFPHLERRKEKARVAQNMRRSKRKMTQADTMLDTAIMDLTHAIQKDHRENS